METDPTDPLIGTPPLFDQSQIFWIDWGTGKIQRANLDGSDVKDVVTNLGSPAGLTLEAASGKMYWIERGSKIQRANLDGSDVEDLVTNIRQPSGITLDTAGGKMYWFDLGNQSPGKIQRANLDGSDVENLVTNMDGPRGLTLDVDGGKIYWMNPLREFSPGTIQRANLDGSDAEVLVSGLTAPLGIELTVDNTLPSAVGEPVELPAAYTLSAPYPNPFTQQTTFTLSLEQPQRVRVALYDARGRRLATLYDGRVQAHQRYTFSIAGDQWASGLYFYEVVGEHFQASRSVALLK